MMGSVMETSDVTPSDPIVPKSEPIHDEYSSSAPSTPEADLPASTQDVVHVQKRKGGRKPVRAMKVTVLCAERRGWLTWLPDLRHFRGAQTEESSGASRLSGKADGIYQAA